ncbi:ankyrin repeat-containing domain protein [Trichoderma barbatum]
MKAASAPLLIAMGKSTATPIDNSSPILVNATDDKGMTPLQHATVMGELSVVTWLLEREADIDATDNTTASAKSLRALIEGGANLGEVHSPTGNTPLHFVMAHDIELAKIILEFRRDIDIDKRNNDQSTPLLYAGEKINLEAFKLLIRAGADINAKDKWGLTPLAIAVKHEFPGEIIDLILEQPDLKIDVIEETEGTALMVACRSLNLEMVTKLLTHGADATLTIKEFLFDNTMLKATCMPFQDAYDARKDNTNAIIRELLAHGADINVIDGLNIYNAICAAAFSSPVGTIHLLLEKGASIQDLDPLGRFPLHFAATTVSRISRRLFPFTRVIL